QARAGEWIVSLEEPGLVRDTDGTIVSTDRVPSFASTPSARTAAAFGRLDGTGIQFKRYLGAEHIFLISAPKNLTFEQVRQTVASIPDIVSVTPNGYATNVTAERLLPNDPDFGQQ